MVSCEVCIDFLVYEEECVCDDVKVDDFVYYASILLNAEDHRKQKDYVCDFAFELVWVWLFGRLILERNVLPNAQQHQSILAALPIVELADHKIQFDDHNENAGRTA